MSSPRTLNFIDLFAGCGGLSLGLTLAGLRGVFAVEKDPMAFDTLATNLIDNQPPGIQAFDWPKWLDKRDWDIELLLQKHKKELSNLRGKIDVLAGGPPCQGFSFAGRRNGNDPRNKLFLKYVQMVELISPSILIMENVPGMAVAHMKKAASVEEYGSENGISYFDELQSELSSLGYEVESRLVNAADFCVPQSRKRLIVVGVRKSLKNGFDDPANEFFEYLIEEGLVQSLEFGFGSPVSSKQAISDLEAKKAVRIPCTDPESRTGFLEVKYKRPYTKYQKYMHEHSQSLSMNSMRMAKHRPEVEKRFERILRECPKGAPIKEYYRQVFGLKKHRVHPMNPDTPAPTITTLPDDILHYDEPRILTVRECARLQSFPDWFRFKGKFTTGGDRRTKECPRYTQVGNAVAPLFARALGKAAVRITEENQASRKRTNPLKSTA